VVRSGYPDGFRHRLLHIIGYSEQYNLQPAPEFLFERRPLTFDCAERWRGRSTRNEGEIPALLAIGNR
jgi:hypothetical protein